MQKFWVGWRLCSRHKRYQLLVIEPVHCGSNSILNVRFLSHPVYISFCCTHRCVIYFYLCVYLHLSPGHSRVVFLLGAAAWPSIDPEVITKRPTRPTLLYSDHPTTRSAIHKHKTHICNTHTLTYKHTVTQIQKIRKRPTGPRTRQIWIILY